MNVKDWISRKFDYKEAPPAPTPIAVAIFIILLAVMLPLWFFLWMPYIDIDTAKWTLSAQVQATAAILGLMIAAAVFRWRTIEQQEEKLRDTAGQYLNKMAEPMIEEDQEMSVSDVMFREYLALVRKDKPEAEKLKLSKELSRTLGHLWVIRQLSLLYSCPINIRLSRLLKRSETTELSQISKLSKSYALNMRENYFINQSEFYLNLLDAIANFREAVVLPNLEEKLQDNQKQDALEKMKYQILDSVTRSIVAADSKLIAERLGIWRAHFKPRFYTACVILSLAIAIGLFILAGIKGAVASPQLSPCLTQWLVMVPVALSVVGLFLSVLTLLLVLR